ncbi:3'-5' exoribonuclease YhaM super family [Candidatus Termititenax dinenymphae]|uniref:3'-5' exoribonuclease YhaM super family n=1 Tax=Candidatus Termititenax dinenymphae TaxID=2218523 RepID=A0A388TKJ3_9BACT|nr:3'-5' exoribonuclease YhaM super family [Candidatus Termititenax dinenymphae]
MTKPMLKDLQLGETVDTFLAVSQKQEKKTKNQDPYLYLRLADASGEVEVNLWKEFADVFPQIQEQSVVKVRGALSEYKSKKQFNITQIRPAAPEEYDLGDFIRKTKKDIPQTLQKVKDILLTISDPDFKKLTDLFLADEKLMADFAKAPAAQNIHSACIGGLLEHVSAILDLALFVAEQYHLNRDLLLLGVFLHDIGKTRELDYAKTTFGYTDEGNLVGHINIGLEILQDKIRQLTDFPAQKKNLLEHLILSHHGVPEFGSPRTPLTMEAVALNLIDNIDAKLVGFQDFVERNPPNGSWTAKAFMFDNRSLYVGPKVI